MNDACIIDALRSAAVAVEIAGAGTLLSRLPEPPSCVRIDMGLHTGIVSYEPSDLVVTVRAGTRVEELNAALAEHRQECPIEGPGSTVGGRIASGLSGVRRLGAGALRDWLLGARIITAAGTAAVLGGRTVKNVTGYDLPRLLCGSWGTLGVLAQVTLRVRPIPFFQAWYATDATPAEVLRALYRPAAIVRTRERTHVLLEGHPDDCAGQAARAAMTEAPAPHLPAGARLAVPPARIQDILARIPGDCAAEVGVGIIHADPPAHALASLRRACVEVGGRLLVLCRGSGVRAFGDADSSAFDARVKRAFDPAGLLAPWRFAA